MAITGEQVKQTEAFQGLTKMMQNIVSRYRNVKMIDNGFQVSKNIGYEKWEQQSQASYQNKEIIKELLQNDN